MYSAEHRREKQREAQARFRAKQRLLHPPKRDWSPGNPKYTEEERRAARVQATLRTRNKRGKEAYNQYMRLHQTVKYRELRQAVHDKLGSKCARCGFDHPAALQIDHVHGGGYKERRAGWQKMFIRILEHPDEYQILCSNCNWIKRWENQEGPYNKEVKSF